MLKANSLNYLQKSKVKNMVSMNTPRIYELWNCATHAVGAILAIVGLALMLGVSIAKADAPKIFSAIIYGMSMVVLYTMSALYHFADNKKVKSILRIFDHCSIFLLIAGTYTPFTMLMLKGVSGIIISTAVWVMAIAGITLNIISIERYKKISMMFYIGMGWIIIFALPQLLANFSINGFILLLLGGIAYTVGVLFYKQKHIPAMHIVWHFFVLAGSAFQFLSIYWYIFTI